MIDFSDTHSNELSKSIKAHSSHIRVLNLSKNKIGDDGIVLLVKALAESSIEVLNLEGNKISDKSVDTIVGCLKTNKTLKQLDL